MPTRFTILERLLSLYSKGYRQRYGDQILQTLADMLDDQPKVTGRAKIWLKVGLDLPISIVCQNSLASGSNLMNDTPKYIKLGGLLAGIMLIPFSLAVIANTLDQAIYNETLYGSRLWDAPILKTWALILPGLALFVAMASYILYVATSGENKWFKRIIDLKHAWPVILTGLFALSVLFFVFFHDSAHCVTGNPVHEIQNWHQTWQCIGQR
ncbi:MAG: hypothetical protein JJD96_02350 [Thermoleophilia bacterium]|nr:hypothetical protein [Thermoleophilia bacterium]